MSETPRTRCIPRRHRRRPIERRLRSKAAETVRQRAVSACCAEKASEFETATAIPSDLEEEVARAFTTSFKLINLAEARERVRSIAKTDGPKGHLSLMMNSKTFK